MAMDIDSEVMILASLGWHGREDRPQHLPEDRARAGAKHNWSLREQKGDYEIGKIAIDTSNNYTFRGSVQYEVVNIDGKLVSAGEGDAFFISITNKSSSSSALVLHDNVGDFRAAVKELSKLSGEINLDIGDFALNTGDTVISGGEVIFGILQELGYAGITGATGGAAVPVVGTDAIDEVGEIMFGTGHVVIGGLESFRLGYAIYSGYQDSLSALNEAYYEFDHIINYNDALAVNYDS